MDWVGAITDQANVLQNIASTLAPVQRMLTGLMYVMGIAFSFKAIYSLKVYGEARTMMSNNASMKEPLTYLLVAGIFIYFPSALEVMISTSFGGDGSVWAYAAISSKNSAFDTLFGQGSVVGKPLVLIIQVVGLIAFARGMVLIARGAGTGSQPGSTGKGFMHVAGGVLAINIVQTLTVINNTLYGT